MTRSAFQVAPGKSKSSGVGASPEVCSLFSTGNVCQVYTNLCHSTDLAFCKPERKLASPVGAVLTWPQSRSALLLGMIFTCCLLTLTSALTSSCLFHLPLPTPVIVVVVVVLLLAITLIFQLSSTSTQLFTAHLSSPSWTKLWVGVLNDSGISIYLEGPHLGLRLP